ncbi:MAG TPA: serine hydrolase [Jiangellaceae bacterium]|nr:serine hydrolase [Jiangellaceae bacterium]
MPADDVYVDDDVADWPRAAPEEAGFDEAALEAAVHDVGLGSTVLSLLVVRGGDLVVEEYFNGAARSHAHNIFSTTKLLTVLAMGAALGDGLFADLETPLAEWVEETAGGPAADVTLEQLLTMRSGLAPEAVEPFSAAEVGAAPLAHEPGTTWEYVTNNSELLALGLHRRAAAGFCEYVHQRILEPLGVTVDHWHETPYGSVTGGSYAFMTPRELARLGQLLLDDGRSGGEQVLPASWIAAITTQRTDFGCQQGNAAQSNRHIRSGSGMHVGLAEVAGHSVWEAGGYGGQVVLVVPDLDLVVVITQEVGPVFERRLSVLDALEFAILPALVSGDAGGGQENCPRSQLIEVDDGSEIVLPVEACCLSDWSPDGGHIAFTSGVDLNQELYVIAADGSGLRRLTDDGASDVLPRWSPDGTRIAFASDRGASLRMPAAEHDLWILDVASGQARALTTEFGDVLGHSWSPDGDTIVFSRAHADDRPGGDLWVVEVDTGNARLLASGDLAWPEWSPRGDSIAVVTQRNGQPFIELLDPATGALIDLAPGDLPRWRPDGRSLLVTRDSSVIAVDLDDGSESTVAAGCCASIAPDGQRIVISVES